MIRNLIGLAAWPKMLGKIAGVALVAWAGLSFLPLPALAHHAMGGRLPMSGMEGFLAGLAHPVIGPDHLLFVLAIGALASTQAGGVWLPVVFVLTGLGGTLLHLAEMNLPLLEIFVSVSLVLAGWLLARRQTPGLAVLLGLGAIAGIFHGYAYAESIIGAESSPLGGYLVGLATIQLGIAVAVCQWCQFLRLSKAGVTEANGSGRSVENLLRYAGFTFFGAGLAFLSGALPSL